MSYTRRIAIEFNHCDPAGIVFYPRYFEMLNSVVENFFGSDIGVSFATMIAQRQGVPMVRLETEFHHPSRLGDVLTFTLDVLKVGRTSAGFRVSGRAAEPRLTALLTVVWIDGAVRPSPWPDAVRARLLHHLEAGDDAVTA